MLTQIGRLSFALVVCAGVFSANAALKAEEPAAWVKENLPEIIKLYQHFHANPELSFQEKETAAKVAAEWKAAGLEVTTGVGGHGVVGILNNGNGPTLMLRTDLDGLPVVEKTDLGYASKAKAVNQEDGQETGVMHACGHDIHIANLVGVARYMATHKDQWRGTLMLIGQPAEERGSGAKAMLDDGLFEKFKKPDFAAALHCDATTPTGSVGVSSGYVLANVDSVDVTVRGRGGHGAYPHTTIDPIVQAAELVLALQAIVAREVKPQEPAVITVGSIHGGTKHNIIGDTCHLQITVRSYSDEVRQQLLQAIERRAKGIAASCDAPEPIIKVSEGTPSLFNDEKLTARLLPVLEKNVGKANLTESEPSMGGEDFSRYGLAGVPVVMYRLGTVAPDRLERYKQLKVPPPSLHSPLYYPDAEATLATGMNTMIAAALEFLKK